MVEAARTTASPAATWAIVIVAVVALAFWLTAIYLADRSQVRASGRAHAATWPPSTGPWTRGSMPGEPGAQIPEQAARGPAGAPAPPGEAPTRADIPAQPAAGTGQPAMPAQRTGAADRAERSYASQDRPDEDGS
jgi:hypothetical protein